MKDKAPKPHLSRLNLPGRKPRRCVAGNPISASQLNETVDAVRSLYGVVPAPVPILEDDLGADEQLVRQFKVRALSDGTTVGLDFVWCERHSGHPLSAGDNDWVKVALPFQLRRTPYDTGTDAPAGYWGANRNGISYAYTSNTARTATDTDEHEEDQVIVPGYVEGDVIVAMKNITGHELVLTQTGEAVEWLDINVDGRAWGAA